ncbi:Bacterial trigger factor protein (TF) [Musa troglodytarum]|uniref:peptidylprolyl isomerase n=1 Tax=Musa troglodytarum TaxID=320322 RepID=A0A9E7GHV5_9LILI|nr:Bacterial trigger factor protein (TF) [Musa troglodytarum]
MELAIRTLCIGLNPEIMIRKQRIYLCTGLPFSRRMQSSIHMKNVTRENFRRDGYKSIDAIEAISSDLESLGNSMAPFEDFTVTVNNSDDREIKIRVDVSGTRTQAIFDDVFSKLVAAAQPIPGFRRVKGENCLQFLNNHHTTLIMPNSFSVILPLLIPKDVLLHIIGPSKVHKHSIKKIINATVNEYIEKESFKVTKDLRVKQSYEELESTFQPGNDFGFDAILQLQETKKSKS